MHEKVEPLTVRQLPRAALALISVLQYASIIDGPEARC